MRGPWQAGGSSCVSAHWSTHSHAPPPVSVGLPRHGPAGYLDAIAGSEEVVEEESVAVDGEQGQQPRGTQQQQDSEGGPQARAGGRGGL